MADLPSHAQVVIIGGGVGGCGIAYHLTLMGWKDVVLLERHELTSGSTWHSAGLVGQMRSDANLTRMMHYSTDLYRRLKDETGHDPAWREVGGLRLASSAERLEEIKRLVGDGHLVAASSQSPYSAVYPDNGKGAHIPATADNIYLVRLFPENAIPGSSTETLYFNVDFRNNSAETGDYSIVITRDASGGARSVALYVRGDTLYADSAVGVQSVLTLQQGIWYNLRLTLDLATRTYAGVVKSAAGTNVIPSRPFVQTGEAINCVYTDGGTSFTDGTAPDHDLDNWALSNTPLEGTPFVKSVSPVGRGHKPDSTIRVELRDASTQVAPGLVELLLDIQADAAQDLAALDRGVQVLDL